MNDRDHLNERGLPPGRPFDPDLETTPREVRDSLAAEERNLVLIDCRRPDEHALCAINAPGEILLPMHLTAARLADLEPHKDRGIVVYCHTGRRSLWVTRFLRDAGFRDVKSMAGGIDLWSVDIDPRVPRY